MIAATVKIICSHEIQQQGSSNCLHWKLTQIDLALSIQYTHELDCYPTSYD